MLLPFDVVEDVKPQLHVAAHYVYGRCYCQVVDGMATAGWYWISTGRCYYQVADGIPTGQCYFNFSSEVLSRTSSHMCGRWYLSVFLLMDGLLTLIYNASFIALLRFWSSLPTMLKLSVVTLWPVVLKWPYIGEVPFDVLLTYLNLYLYMTPLFFWTGSWSFGTTRRFLMVLPPLK